MKKGTPEDILDKRIRKLEELCGEGRITQPWAERTKIELIYKYLDLKYVTTELGQMVTGGQPRCDVLLVVATRKELRAVNAVLQDKFDRSLKPFPIGSNPYSDLGIIGNTRVYLALTKKGPGESQQTVNNAIGDLNPLSIILLGIAFGVDKKKQKIGEVLISECLYLYEDQRVGTSRKGKAKKGKIKITHRGKDATATTRLVNTFEMATITWTKAKVHVGILLSGSKLIDNLDYRESIRKESPEAIGGEMEGAGLYSAAHDKKKDWVVVKAICDWADGNKKINKEKRQAKAALNAAKFVFHVLEMGSLQNTDMNRNRI
jgi:nucleoside phosphorylase